MTALEAIALADGQQPNALPLADKLRWLNQVETEVRALLARCGQAAGAGEMAADTVLLAPAPYEGIYTYFLEAQLHYANQEYLKFNNAMSMFSALWQEYASAVRRGAPGDGRRKFF